ncbi:MAG: DNA polymerase III, subunit gamma and tau [Elusimicrobia bacterium RIFCSPHIGHO2_02_FULL_57_9]|nr:MAG: DNA polymerase III, subunit gamma and tau [Elusimicrobia bacterium RIFCSPHIGHO2_02_FULL_57_9]
MSKQSYVVLARKYRPQGFDGVLGQPAIAVTLKNALSAKKPAHAYLFTGPRGVGKTTMARILAKALNCAKGLTPEPCADCDCCREIAASSCLDVLEMDAASHSGVDNVREVIIDTVALAPSRDRYKVFIIDEAHMLSTAAFNALLKTLEEPPAHVVFILATTESAKIPATIASRCQRFKFRPVDAQTMTEHLASLAKKEKISIEKEALELLSRNAEGSLRDAISLLDQCRSFSDDKITDAMIREMFGLVPEDMLLALAQALLSRDAQGLARWLRNIYAEGVEPGQLLRDLRAALEPVYIFKLGLEGDLGRGWKDLAQKAGAQDIAYVLRRLNRILEELRFGDCPRLTLELGFFSCLEAAGDLAAWVERLEGLEKRLGAGQAAVPAPAAGGDVWAALVADLRQDKAVLAATLEKARVARSEAGPWKIGFKRSFDLEQARRNLSMIEAKLATLAQRSIRLELEVGACGAEIETVVDSAIPEPGAAASAPEGAAWHDINEIPAAPSASAAAAVAPLKKAQEILGGKIRVVKKKP